jgi:hypothetical protein
VADKPSEQGEGAKNAAIKTACFCSYLYCLTKACNFTKKKFAEKEMYQNPCEHECTYTHPKIPQIKKVLKLVS